MNIADEMHDKRTTKVFLLFVDLEEHLLRLGGSLKPLNEFDKAMFKGVYKVFRKLGSHSAKNEAEYSYYANLIKEQIIPDVDKLHLRLSGHEEQNNLHYELKEIKEML